MKEYKMWIGGKWVETESGKTFTTVNPATEEVIKLANDTPFGLTATVR